MSGASWHNQFASQRMARHEEVHSFARLESLDRVSIATLAE